MAIYSGFSHWKWWFSIAMLNYQRVNPPSENSSPTQISDDTLPLRWRGARAEAQFTSPAPFKVMAQKMTDPVKTRLYHSIIIVL